MTGPIDYIIVGFEGNKFDGSILEALEHALDAGIIRLLALALITKDDEGKVMSIDVEDIDDSYVVNITEKYPPDSSLIEEDDVAEVGDLLENNTSAGMLVIEHLWALPLKQAIVDAGGVLISDGRIHPDAAEELDNE